MADGVHVPPVVADRSPVLLDGDWRCSVGGDAEVVVRVPHTFNAVDGHGPAYRRTIARYHRMIRASRVSQTRTILYLEAVNQVAAVRVDGRPVGGHRGGYTGFAVDLTDALAPGEHDVLLEVDADNRHRPDTPPLSADFTFYGGIYRHVWLFSVPDVHVAIDHGGPGVRVETSGMGADTVADVVVPVVNAGPEARRATVSVDVHDSAGAPIGTSTIDVDVPAGGRAEPALRVALPFAQRWSQDVPVRHSASVRVRSDAGEDRVVVPFGIREITLVGGRVLVDGRPANTLGTARHQDVVGRGWALDDDTHRADLRLLADLGVGVVRLAHYPQADVVLDEADRLGLLVWEEIPVVNEITTSAAFAECCLAMQQEMIAQHRHHPCVAIWGYLNEILIRPPAEPSDRYLESVVELAERLEAQSRRLDPSRLTAIAAHRLGGGDEYDRSGLTELPMIVGWNVYAGWYEGSFEDLGPFLDAQHADHPDRALWLSEFGADCLPDRHAAEPRRGDGSIEWALRFHASYLDQIAARPWLTGATSWIGFDFAVAGREGVLPGVNAKGLFTADRRPKATAELYRTRLAGRRHDSTPGERDR